MKRLLYAENLQTGPLMNNFLTVINIINTKIMDITNGILSIQLGQTINTKLNYWRILGKKVVVKILRQS